MQIHKILRYYNVNKNDESWCPKARVFWGGNRYNYVLPMGTISLFSQGTQSGNRNIQISSLYEKSWKIPNAYHQVKIIFIIK